MQTDEFESIFEKQVDLCRRLLVTKAKEYAKDGTDRLHNFKLSAHLRQTTPTDALGGFMLKHTVSLYDMLDSDPTTFSMEMWEEKITDHINYLILLRACVEEAFENQHPALELDLEPEDLQDIENYLNDVNS